MRPTFGVGRMASAVGFQQIELQLGRGDGGEAHVLQRRASHFAAPGAGRRRKARQLRSPSRAAPARSAPGPRAPARASRGLRWKWRRVAVAAAVVDALERLALAVEQHGRPAEVHAALERLRELIAHHALAAQDAEHVRLQQLEELCVGMLIEKRFSSPVHACCRCSWLSSVIHDRRNHADFDCV